ncbi:hypothetical protein BDW_04175 [Bdellovibrio bacteriovorus W]|nr:hypothetical protein BDW_04175 [Bdellovibrio bacteriovorus W]
MSWIEKYLSAKDLEQIEKTIDRVEEQTHGEIVPVIVRKSSTVGHVPLTLTLLLTLIVVMIEFPYSDWLWVTPWVYLWPFLILALFGISHFLAKIPWIQKILVPEKDEVEQVQQRAHLEFYMNRVHRTEAGTGVLIFVSVMEKKAVVLADEGIAQKLPSATWDGVLEKLRKSLHDGQWGQGFVQAIEECGEHLKTHFPIENRSANQLKNHLVIKD